MTFIATLCALALCVGLCVFSLHIIRGSVDEMTERCKMAERAFHEGDIQMAARILEEASEYWDKTRRIMEIVVSHNMLMRVTEAEVKARANLTSNSIYEFERAMAVLYNALTDVEERESPTITNIF